MVFTKLSMSSFENGTAAGTQQRTSPSTCSVEPPKRTPFDEARR
jgi:hypothetical protein